MNRFSVALGVPAGAIMIASSAAHSLLGWPQLRASLARAQTPPDLITGIAVAWHFGGVAMFAFGSLVILLFVDVLRHRSVSFLPAWLIALLYTVFGCGALFVTGNPFFLIFVVPGVLLAAASW